MINLFSEFPIKSEKEWKNKIISELKELDYHKTLVYSSLEGIDIQPIYTKEFTDYLPLSPLPKTQSNWDIFTEITDHSILNENEVDGFIVNLDKNEMPINGYKNILVCNDLNRLKEINFSSTQNFLQLDIYGNLFSTGNWFVDQSHDENLILHLLENKNLEKIICINNALFQNAGANCIQQLAFVLSHANDYIEKFGEKIIPKLYFNFAVGGNYFFEIAKLRAFRFMWQSFLESKNIDLEAYIFTESSMRNKSIFDSFNNVIRNTLEISSAIFGGSNGILIHAHDSFTDRNEINNFSAELAHKEQLILKKESYLDKFSDPIEGNYFVESITNQMIEKAGDLFKKIEKNGGLIASMKQGMIQKMVNESHEKEQSFFDEQKQVLIGVNKFKNKEEKIENQFVPTQKNDSILFEPILAKRLAQKIEKNE